MQRQRESGMAIVEVLIAVIILAAVASSVALATVGSAKVRGTARLQTSLTSSGMQVQEDIATDRDWMRVAGCKQLNTWCDIRPFVRPESLKLEDVGGVATLEYARSTALDSPLDQLGPADADGVIPDYYRIEVSLRAADEVAGRYGVATAKTVRRFVTTIDRRGVEQVGSIAVEVCKLTNQSDERMQIQGCTPTGRSDIGMLGCAPGAVPECGPAVGWVTPRPASDVDPALFVGLRRVTTSFTLVNTSSGAAVSSGSATRVDGLYVFQNLPAGEYRLAGLPASMGARTERWKSKELPTFHGPSTKPTITVEAGIRARALVLYRHTMNPGGIDLFFQRRTRTYNLRGPFTASETSVPEMAPTDSYIGASAASHCGTINDAGGQFNTLTCLEPPTQVSPNCVEIMVVGTIFKDVGEGNGNITFLYPDVIEGLPNSGTHLKIVLPGPTPASRFCTFYAEYLTHTYWGQVSNPPWDIRNGAAAASAYSVDPLPDVRHVEYGAGGPYVQTPQCIVAWKSQCTTSGGADSPALRAGIKPGLNSPVNISDPAGHALNTTFSGTPGWLRGPLWARPDGAITARDGSSHAPGARVNFMGLGECYWRSPRFGGEQLGPCNPCNPVWQPGWTIAGCAILTDTHWERPAWEVVTALDIEGDGQERAPYTKRIETKSGDIVYNPPWQCTSTVPRVANGATCSATPRGGGEKGIPLTKHPASGSGVAVVKKKSFGGGGGV